jgi:hypothetical protein
MKPSSWYTSTLVVVFLYLYVLAVQYIRAEELQADRSSSKIIFDDGKRVDSAHTADPSGSVISVEAGSVSDALPSLYASEDQGGSPHSVGTSDAADVSPSLFPGSAAGDRETGIAISPSATEMPGGLSYFNDGSSYPSKSTGLYNPDSTGSVRAVGHTGSDRAVGSHYRPGYSYDPSYNRHNQFYSGIDSVPAAAGKVNPHQQDGSYTLDFKYHNYDKLTKFLRTTSSKFPNLTALYSIGKSVQGKSVIWYIYSSLLSLGRMRHSPLGTSATAWLIVPGPGDG